MPDDNDFYKGVIDNLYDGVYFVDRDRAITYWNNGAERITGYKGGQVVGSSCRNNILNHVTADGIELCTSRVPGRLHAGRSRPRGRCFPAPRRWSPGARADAGCTHARR